MELFRLLGTIAINSKEAIAEINKTTDSAEKSSTKISNSFKSIGTKSKELGEKFRGVSMAAGGLLTSLVATTEMTRDYRTEQGKLEAAFTTSGHSAENATKTFEGLQAVLGETDRSVEAANHLAKLCQTEQELQTWTNICTGVFAEFGDSLPIEGLTEAANETAKTGVVTGSLADALNWAGVSEDAFNSQLASCTDEQERQALITETLNGLYEDSAEAYKKANKEVMAANQAQENLTNSLSLLSEKIEPIITKFKNLAATVLEKIAGMNDGVFNFILVITGIVAALAPVLSIFGMMATGVGSLIKVFGSLPKIIAVVKTAFTTLGAAMMANPVGLVIAGITALITAFTLLWNHCEGFREFWINLWETIKAKFAEAKDRIVEIKDKLVAAFKTVIDFFQNNWKELLMLLVNPFTGAFALLYKHNDQFRANVDALKTKVVNIFNNLKTGLANIFNGIRSTAQNVWNAIKNAIVNPIENAREKVKSMLDKIKGMFPLKIGKIFSNLRLPRITVDAGKAPFGIGGKGEKPSFGVHWNAMGAIFKKPTIFSTAQGFQGVGEAGAEAVAPIDTLQQYVATAVASQNTELVDVLHGILSAIKDMDSGMYKNIEHALDNRKIQWNDRELGRLVSKYA